MGALRSIIVILAPRRATGGPSTTESCTLFRSNFHPSLHRPLDLFSTLHLCAVALRHSQLEMKFLQEQHGKSNSTLRSTLRTRFCLYGRESRSENELLVQKLLVPTSQTNFLQPM